VQIKFNCTAFVIFINKKNTMKNIFILLFAISCINCSAQSPEEILKAKEIEFSVIPPPVANYVNVVRVGNLLYLSGKGPLQKNGIYITGKVGKDLSIDQGYEAARLTAIIQISVLKNELGSLSKVKRIVKVLGMVNSDSNFTDHPKVINGFSDLMVAVFGEKGRHARSAIGVASLPMNIAVEVEMIVEVE